MTKRRKMARMLLGFTFLLLFSVCVSAAETTVDFDRKGSLCITLRDNEDDTQIVQGADLTLYQVGTAAKEKGTLTFEPAAQFAGAGFSFANLRRSGLASDLWTYAQNQNIAGTEQTTGEDGTVYFEDLELGLYLVVQTGIASGYYAIDPFLVSIPMTEQNEWNYDIEADPKVQPAPQKLENLSVRKVWEDKNSKNRPTSIEIQLLKDKDQVVETVQLNQSNAWSYTWKNLASEYSWTVRENNVPKGYSVSYRKSGDEVIVTNTATLIQTGQLNWPIVVMAAGGVLLIAAGCWLCLAKRKHQNET